MRRLVPLVLLLVAACAPTRYPQCMEALEARYGREAVDHARWEASTSSMYLKVGNGMLVADWRECCDLPDVYPEDSERCVAVREALRPQARPPIGR